MDSIFGSFDDLVAVRPIEHLACNDLSFCGQLSPSLRVVEDGGASGCGGKVWIAGELLCEYILEKTPQDKLLGSILPKDSQSMNNVLELGSGTGIVGLCVSLLAQQHHFPEETHVNLTDSGMLVPLMKDNIVVNGVSESTEPTELLWGTPIN